MPEELIQKIEFLLINEGQKDQRLKWGEWIKYTPCQVGDMLRKHADEFSEFQFGASGEVNRMGESKKPPLGLEPRWVHDSKRVKNILDAIERYTDANMSIPKKWVEELKDLFNAYFEEYPAHTVTRR